jgi:hypothetical protein
MIERNLTAYRRTAKRLGGNRHFPLAQGGCASHYLPASPDIHSRVRGIHRVSNGMMILFTPVPVPRKDRNELRVSGCAAPAAGQELTHVFLDWQNRGGHELCELRAKSGFGPCGKKKLVGPRFWDFRDSMDSRTQAVDSPYHAVRDFIYKSAPAAQRTRLFPTVASLDKIIELLAEDPSCGHGWINPDLLPKSPVDGLLRTKCLTQRNNGVTLPSRNVDEAIVLNQSTLQDP